MSSTLQMQAGFIVVTFDLLGSPGAISVPGLQVGDVMLSLSVLVDAGNHYGNGSLLGQAMTEAVVSTADELQQNDSIPWSGITLTAIFYRGS